MRNTGTTNALDVPLVLGESSNRSDDPETFITHGLDSMSSPNAMTAILTEVFRSLALFRRSSLLRALPSAFDATP